MERIAGDLQVMISSERHDRLDGFISAQWETLIGYSHNEEKYLGSATALPCQPGAISYFISLPTLALEHCMIC